MCHRLLKFVKCTRCDRNTFLDGPVVDCLSPECTISSAHPSTCGSPSKPCACRRYYEQPERLVTRKIPGPCSICPSAP